MVNTRELTRLALCAAASLGIAPAAANPGESERFFDEKIAPILSRHCLECHDTAISKGDLDLSLRQHAMAPLEDGPAIIPGDAENSPLWQDVVSGNMPEDRPPLSAGQIADLKKWINDGAVWSSDELDSMAHTRDPRAAQDWVKRLTNSEYIRTVQAVTGVDISKEATAALPRELRADGFSNTAYNLTIDIHHVQAYSALAAKIAGTMDISAFAKAHTPGEIGQERLDHAIAGMGRWISRRPLPAHEMETYRKIAASIADEEGSFDDQLRGVVEAMLQSPAFLYRIESAAGGENTNGVSAWDLASRLSYAIWGGPPDEKLYLAAESGALLQPEPFNTEVARMLQDPRIRERSLEFASEWLNLGRIANLRPDPRKFPLWTPGLAQSLKDETMAFFEELVWEKNLPLSQLFNADFTVATPRLAAHYQLPRRPALTNGEGLLVLYEFNEMSGDTIRDQSGHPEPVDLKIADLSKVEWESSSLTIREPTVIRSLQPFARGAEALRQSQELTVEAWVESSHPDQKGPARIFSFSSGTSDRNFTLGQENRGYEMRVRTSQTGKNGSPGLQTPQGLFSTALHHLVYTKDRKKNEGRFYWDGELIASTTLPGDLNNWDRDFHLLLANEPNGERPWRGTFHRLALYNRVLAPDEVFANAGGRQLYDLTNVPARGGLLTHASLLTIGGDEASMVTRGLFILHDVLHSAVGSPPPGVDTTPVPPKKGTSQRAMALKRLETKSCAGCHSKFEPLAFGLEKFDGTGAHSDHDHHGNLLREDGTIQFPGQKDPLPFQSTAELMDHLAASDRVSRNFTRKLTQFTLGRPLTGTDSKTLQSIHQQAMEGGGTYRSLISSIVSSDLIRSRPTSATP